MLERLSDLIRELESQSATRVDPLLVHTYRSRARIAVKWGEDRLRNAAEARQAYVVPITLNAIAIEEDRYGFARIRRGRGVGGRIG